MSYEPQVDYAKPEAQRRYSRLGVASVVFAVLSNPWVMWAMTARLRVLQLLPTDEHRALARMALFPIACLVLSIVALVRVLRSPERLRGEYVAAIGAAISLTWVLLTT